jgi:hypothetical protein
VPKNQPDETRGPRPGPQEIRLAAAPPQRESRRRPALPVARSPPLQPSRPSVPTFSRKPFRNSGNVSSPAWAGKFLDQRCRQTMRSRIGPMKKDRLFATQSSRTHPEYFRAQKLLSSGVVEGLNNQAKVTMRKSYGFRKLPRCRTCPLSLTWQPGPSRSPPTISSDEPKKGAGLRRLRLPPAKPA